MRSLIIIWLIAWSWLGFVQWFAGPAASMLCAISMLAVCVLCFWETGRNARTSKGSSDE